MAIPKLIHYSDNSYVTSEGTLFEDFETFSDWTKIEGHSIEANSINTREGILSLKFNSVGGAVTVADKTISKDFSAVTNFIVWLYVHDLYLLEECYFVFSSVTDWSKYVAIQVVKESLKPGWNRVVMAKGQFGVNGGESWSNTMIRMRIKCKARLTYDTAVSFDDFRYDYAGKAKCILTFDLCCGFGVYDNGKPIMDTNGQAGVAFAVPHNYTPYNINQLTTMQSADWDISNHSWSHPELPYIPQVEMEQEIDLAYDWLVANGFGRGARFFAYPGGAYSSTVITKLKERHRIARTIIGYLEDHDCYQPHFNLNDDDIEFLVKVGYPIVSVTPATVQGWIDNTIIQKGLLVLLFHTIVESGATESWEYNKADFETISNYLKTKADAGLIDVITFSDYYDQFMPSDLTSVVYLKNAAIVPYPIVHEPSESIGRSEDKRLKVYSHSLAGDRKRTWRIKCRIDNSGNSGYKWRDLEYFYWKVVEGAKHRCVFVDANSVQYLVRIIGFAQRVIGAKNKYEVTMILEEDYI